MGLYNIVAVEILRVFPQNTQYGNWEYMKHPGWNFNWFQLEFYSILMHVELGLKVTSGKRMALTRFHNQLKQGSITGLSWCLVYFRNWFRNPQVQLDSKPVEAHICEICFETGVFLDRFNWKVLTKIQNQLKHITCTERSDRMQKCQDWEMVWDEDKSPAMFPHVIVVTAKRPDVTIYSTTEEKKWCVVIELTNTVPAEENFAQANSRKKCKYTVVL